jgi:hypothetical protein
LILKCLLNIYSIADVVLEAKATTEH